MAKLKLSGKELRAIGYPEGPVISLTMNLMEKHYKHAEKEEVMNILRSVLVSPVEFAGDAVLALIAEQLIPKEKNKGAVIRMNDIGIHFDVFGAEQIEPGAMVR
jgi:tRNA-splicing ligase RtcB